MIEFYPEIRVTHVWAVIASGMLFGVRGLAACLGAGWARAVPLRVLSYAIDTVLLTAALMLATMLRQYPFVQPWLTVKVVLLVVYIGLGYVALRGAWSRAARFALWLLAVGVYVFIYSVARAHHPLGLLRGVLG